MTTADEVIAWVRANGSKKVRDGMTRFAIPNDKASGIQVGTMRAYAKKVGRDHALAAALWKTGWYEARMLACFIDDPAQVTAAQMDAWAKDFDSWGITDTACFALFAKTPDAWAKAEQWAKVDDELVKRAAFAMLASLVLHDKSGDESRFVRGLALIERGARDERNFVKKAVNWALRTIGKKNAALNAAAIAVSERLAASAAAAPRWVGKDALRELTSPAVQKRLAAPRKRAAAPATKRPAAKRAKR
jgi:3-methyladenine DNA glycosylase AlkD